MTEEVAREYPYHTLLLSTTYRRCSPASSQLQLIEQLVVLTICITYFVTSLSVCGRCTFALCSRTLYISEIV